MCFRCEYDVGVHRQVGGQSHSPREPSVLAHVAPCRVTRFRILKQREARQSQNPTAALKSSGLKRGAAAEPPTNPLITAERLPEASGRD